MNFLDGLTQAVVPYKEALNPVSLGLEGGVDSDEHQYRRLTQSTKDLSPHKLDRAQSIAFYLYMTNPIAYRLTEITKDFTIGKGLGFEAEDDRVKAVLDEHWNHPVNNWELKQHSRVLELGLYGELFNPLFVNERNGDVTVACLDPLNVKAVITDPDNVEVPEKVLKKGQGGMEGKTYDVLKHNDKGFLEGDMLMAQIKRVSNMTRGTPDMMAALDYMDAFDDILFGEIERVKLMRAFVEDITVDGADENQLNEYRRKYRNAPKWGTRWFHNEKVTREFLSPKIESADLEKFLKMLLAIILGAQGVPEHYFALAYDINRATSDNMEPPIIRRIQTRQNLVGDYFGRLFNFVITQAALHGKATKEGLLREADLKRDETFSFEVQFPNPSQKEITEAAQSLVNLVQALSVAEINEWISKDKSREAFAMVVGEFGVDIEPSEMAEQIENQQLEESVGMYAYRELKDEIEWLQNGNGELREAVKKEVRKKLKKKKSY